MVDVDGLLYPHSRNACGLQGNSHAKRAYSRQWRSQLSEKSRDWSDRSDRVAARIRNVIGSVHLDCDCRKRLNDALDRFLEQEKFRDDRRHLLEARQQRTAISAMLDLLGELEEISWLETDRSAFAEIAHIFDDVAQAALAGAAAMRLMAGDHEAVVASKG